MRSISSFTKNPVSSLRAAAAEIALAFLRVSLTESPSLIPSAYPAIIESPHPTVLTASIFGTSARKMPSSQTTNEPSPPRETATDVYALLMDFLCRFDHVFHMVTGLSGKHPDLVDIRLDHRRARLDSHLQKLSACIQDDRFSGFLQIFTSRW